MTTFLTENPIKRNRRKTIFLLFVFLIAFMSPGDLVNAQSVTITWEAPINLSRTPEKRSTDPFLLADPSGGVHLFWSEKVSETTGALPDTLIYAYWDGNSWSKPIDIFFAPDSLINPIVSLPHAVLDDQGTIHLIWLSNPLYPGYSLFYSSANSNEAGAPQGWQPSTKLFDGLTGTEYSIDIAYTPPGVIHILFARVPQGGAPGEQRAVTYLRSKDRGLTWSNPVDLYAFRDISNGASNVRLYASADGKIYASWTEWNVLGNGERIYLARSVDNGESWEDPQVLAERKEDWYETDWFHLTSLGENRLLATWEGGPFAFLNFMYSDDGGESWSEALDSFPDLTGENGFAEYIEDSAGNFHIFVPKRVRQGSTRTGGLGLWHSVWKGGKNWTEPELSNGLNDMVNPKVVLTGGNQIMAAWYSHDVFEIIVMNGTINNAPSVPYKPWPTPTIKPTDIQVSSVNDPVVTPTLVIPPLNDSQISPSGFQPSLSSQFLLGVLPSLVVIGLFLILRIRQFQKSR